MILIIVGFAVSVVCLVTSARIIETSFVEFAHKFKINEFFLGFVVLGLVTSLPEISVAIFSSSKNPELSTGNLIGATTVILTLIIGISAIKYRNLSFESKFAEKEVIFGIFVLSAMVLAVIDQRLVLIEGIILLAAYCAYIFYLNRKLNSKKDKVFFLNISTKKTSNVLLRIIIGIVVLLISSSYAVDLSQQLALSLGVSESFVGIILLAIGTNLPEITILLTSKTAEQENLALGNFFGSACVNTGVLGMLAILSNGFELQDFPSIIIGIVILVFALVLFAIFSWTGRKIDRVEGILLITLYIALLLAELLTKASGI